MRRAETAGFVQLRGDDCDRRAKFVVVTARGARPIEKGRRLSCNAAQELQDQLGAELASGVGAAVRDALRSLGSVAPSEGDKPEQDEEPRRRESASF